MCVISPFSKAQKAIKSDVIIHSHLHNKNTKLFHVKLCHINFLLMSVPWLSLTIFTRYEFNSGTNLPQIIISCAFQWIFSVCNLPHFRKYFTFQKKQWYEFDRRYAESYILVWMPILNFKSWLDYSTVNTAILTEGHFASVSAHKTNCRKKYAFLIRTKRFVKRRKW